MYNEIVQADPTIYYDKTTQTAIGVLKHRSKAGWMKRVYTWFSFNNKNSTEELANFVVELRSSEGQDV